MKKHFIEISALANDDQIGKKNLFKLLIIKYLRLLILSEHRMQEQLFGVFF